MSETIGSDKILEESVDAHGCPVALVKMADPEDGEYAVVTNCGFNPVEGFNELDYQFFDSLAEAKDVFLASQKTGQ